MYYIVLQRTGDEVRSLGNNICGFKLINAQYDKINEWSISVLDIKGQYYAEASRIFVGENPGKNILLIHFFK